MLQCFSNAQSPPLERGLSRTLVASPAAPQIDTVAAPVLHAWWAALKTRYADCLACVALKTERLRYSVSRRHISKALQMQMLEMLRT